MHVLLLTECSAAVRRNCCHANEIKGTASSVCGGHLKTQKVEDIFLNKSDFRVFASLRYNTKNTHGTGCTLSSAIATFFSCGKTIKKACELGIKYVNSAILTNPKYGKGHGPINHLNSMIISKKFK